MPDMLHDEERQPGVIITHPNRDKPAVQATRATVILLFLVSAAMVLIVTIGGWKVLEGAKPIQIAYIIVYLDTGLLRRPLEPGRAAGRRRAGGAAGDLRAGGCAGMVLARQSPALNSRPSTPACWA